jgi:hypothetical protein
MYTRVTAQLKDVNMAMTVFEREQAAGRVCQAHHLAVAKQLHAEAHRLHGMCHQLIAVMNRWASEMRTVSRAVALL